MSEDKLNKSLRILIAKKEKLFRRIQVLYDLSKEVPHDMIKRNTFELRLCDLEKTREEFENVLQDITDVQLSLNMEFVISNKESETFDQLYYTVKSVAREFLQPVSQKTQFSSSYADQMVRPRLPKINLFNFDGDIENWTTFYESFTSLVHDNEHINNIDKYHYLLSSTSGAANVLVKSLPITADNYGIIWQSLINKYQDKRNLAAKYLNKMLNFSALQKDTISGLNSYLEVFQNSYRALLNLNIENLSNFVFCHVAIRALDLQTQKRFEQSCNQSELPNFDSLLEFVANEIKILERSTNSPRNIPPITTKSDSRFNNPSNSRTISKGYHNKTGLTSQSSRAEKMKFSCIICAQAHSIYKCETFRNGSLSMRFDKVRSMKLCENCLKNSHSVDDCPSTISCGICAKRHHYLLHKDAGQLGGESSTSTVVQKSACYSNSVRGKLQTVLLGTAVIHVQDGSGEFQECRALADLGAMTSFISNKCIQRLGLTRSKCPFSINGLGGESVQNFGLTNCVIKPVHAVYPLLNVSTVILSKITSDMPAIEIPQDCIREYQHLKLADQAFYKPAGIDILLGADILPQIYVGNNIIIRPEIPAAMGSIFGYIITGKLEASLKPTPCVSSLYASAELSLDSTLRKFWEIESCSPCEIQKNPDDVLCEEIYINNVERDSSGRYTVPLPFKSNPSELGETYDIALSRLYSLEKRLSRSRELASAYGDFLREYEQLNHMSEIKDANVFPKYYIPHHCVIKPLSSTTKTRVVFDASSKATNNVSLNQLLSVGPKLQKDIFDVLINFRLNAICFTADIAKMYRQILIKPEHRLYQCILWRNSPEEPVKRYMLNTVTYGVSSAPYLSIRTLQQLSNDDGALYPKAAFILKHGIYVDDILWSVDSVEEATRLQVELISLLKRGGFELRKWTCNSDVFLANIPSDHCEKLVKFSDDGNLSIKVLGLQWSPRFDHFSFFASPVDKHTTKRSVLRIIASIYDPIGLIAPCVFYAKCMLQRLWRLSVDWDQPLPPNICEKWLIYLKQLPLLSELKIERQLLIANYTNCQLIGFCDGSELGYGCVIFVRSENNQKQVKTNIIAAKSKVAPSQTISIPRMELMGCWLLSRLFYRVRDTLQQQNINITHIEAFSDSKSVLYWLQTPPYKLKTYVGNRVSLITEIIPPSAWFHVRSENNIADICSRGALPVQFIELKTWFSGPDWLQQPRSCWPISSLSVNTQSLPDSVLPEMKSTAVTAILVTGTDNKHDNFEDHVINYYSSFSKLIRTVAWCKRFTTNARLKRPDRISGILSVSELNTAEETLIKTIQYLHFSEVLKQVAQGCLKDRSLCRLSPFIDNLGILRVGGRIQYADVPFGMRHPKLLPNKCHFTNILVDYFHKAHLHVGPRTLQSIISQNYWIVSARRVIRSRLCKCVICFKHKPSSLQPAMAQLPPGRLGMYRVFRTVSVDLGGPFYIKESLRRNAKLSKAYICLFVCFSSKAVHLELLSSLSSECFIAALDRFVSRRGLCETIISDNGGNFVASNKYLNEVRAFLLANRDELIGSCAIRKIEWKFNPPLAPHFNGLVESGIKSVKYHLKRALGDQHMTFEEMSSLLCRIEAILNSRPLCALSNDANEFDALSPAHFLIGSSLISAPERIFDDIPLNRLNRWQLVKATAQHFWRRFKNEYLHTLQQKSKWLKGDRNLKIGDLVLIHSDTTPSQNWAMGRVLQTHPGTDNIVRVVTLRTANGTLKRPVVKLFPLPCN